MGGQHQLSLWRATLFSLTRFWLQVLYISCNPQKLPKGIIEEIERLCRKFLWGGTNSQSKIHLLNWDSVTQPMERGGLGIKRLAEFNNACLAKMCWGLVTYKDQLWAKVLWRIYDKSDSITLPFNCKKNASRLWNSLCDVWSFISWLDVREWLLGPWRVSSSAKSRD